MRLTIPNKIEDNLKANRFYQNFGNLVVFTTVKYIETHKNVEFSLPFSIWATNRILYDIGDYS